MSLPSPTLPSSAGDFFDLSDFQSKVSSSLESISKILSNERHPIIPSDCPHSYDDKYGLATYLMNMVLCSSLSTLELFGIDNEEIINKLFNGVADGKSVILTFAAEEKCQFLKETIRKEESKTQYVREVTTNVGYSSKETHKTIRTITEYHWKFSAQWNIFLSFGDNTNDKITLNSPQSSRSSNIEIITTSKLTPHPESSTKSPITVNLTYLFMTMSNPNKDSKSKNKYFHFSIDRKSPSCKTPRRNPEVTAGLYFFSQLLTWANEVLSYFRDHLFPIQTSHGLELSAIVTAANDIFNPFVPLFESENTISNEIANTKESKKDDSCIVSFGGESSLGDGKSPPLLSANDANLFLTEEKRSLITSIQIVTKTFPLRTLSTTKLISATECIIQLGCLHLQSITYHIHMGLNYIENMLRTQLVSAIGKVLEPSDFQKYMKYHANKIFLPPFQPIPFSFDIRRPHHSPEGTISIEEILSGRSDLPSPCSTHCRVFPSTLSHPMSFPINASTRIPFKGQRYLHALINHQFEGKSSSNYQLVARTRQFSSFLLVVGTIESAISFSPKSAIILQNKDELTIPLLLETIPSAKEFRDAVSSLSPEQQRFAKAYRGMQLDSSLFGLLIIQLKPQLEILTRLPYDCLTKEIQLTQELLEIFIKYQIPSDLLTFNGDPKTIGEEKLLCVWKYVRAVRELIEKNKTKQLEEKKQEAIYHQVNSIAKSTPYGSVHPTSTFSLMSSSSSVGASPRSAVPSPKRFMMSAPRQSASSSTSVIGSIGASVNNNNNGNNNNNNNNNNNTTTTTTTSSSTSPSSTPSEVKESDKLNAKSNVSVSESENENNIYDYTTLPRSLDSSFLELDDDGAIRTTTITTAPTWTKKSKKSLLSPIAVNLMGTTELLEEKNKSFDLLDAISRSGSLMLSHCELHVIVGVTHVFDKSVMNTLIQDNMNPIEKVEKTNLILASAIHSSSAQSMVKPKEIQRVETYSPKLFINGNGNEKGAVAVVSPSK